MYYKIVLDGQIVDACDGLSLVKRQQKNGIWVSSSEEYAMGILSSDGTTIFLLEGTDEISGYSYASYAEITEEEYIALCAAILSGQEVTDSSTSEETLAEDTSTIEYIRAAKITEMSKACEAAMDAGFTVTLSDGEQHLFTLTIADHAQMNSLSLMLASGQEAFTYHASGEPCKFYSAQDMLTITTAATEFKTYHETYNNSLKLWIQQMTTIAEISAVTYGIEIPEEYRSEVLSYVIAKMGATAETEVAEE